MHKMKPEQQAVGIMKVLEGDGISEYKVGKEIKLQKIMQPVYKKRSGRS
jgi:hypothetical protein